MQTFHGLTRQVPFRCYFSGYVGMASPSLPPSSDTERSARCTARGLVGSLRRNEITTKFRWVVLASGWQFGVFLYGRASHFLSSRPGPEILSRLPACWPLAGPYKRLLCIWAMVRCNKRRHGARSMSFVNVLRVQRACSPPQWGPRHFSVFCSLRWQQ